MKLGLGICNYNRANDACQAVQAALDQSLPPDALVVLDNASTDDSVSRLENQFGDRISLLTKRKNTGGAGGFSELSQALLSRGADLITLVDSDCFLQSDALQYLAKALDSTPDIGVCGARIMHADRSNVIQECGAFIDWENASFQLNRRDQDLTSAPALPNLEYVDYVPACALMARHQVFNTIGHFNPNLFIYFDDIEWCHKATQSGYRVAVANQAEAIHKGGGKTKTSHFPTYYYWRNRIHFFLTHGKHSQQSGQYLLETATRAIATSETLTQPNSAETIRQATLDALQGRFGQKDFATLNLELDPPSPYLQLNGKNVEPILVDHIFDPVDRPEDTIRQDIFGKRIQAKTSRALFPKYQLALQRTKQELAPLFQKCLNASS
ncbi:glycosyl transferase, group 2 family protein [Verrucomicrobiia bacterium DG1235]|nr:glycosyl transferase, group 2 family protein [Verrucomicrobiae bacterium DG1235]